MSTIKIKGSWNEVKEELKGKFGNLTEMDIQFLEEQEDKLVRIQDELIKKTKEIAMINRINIKDINRINIKELVC